MATNILAMDVGTSAFKIGIFSPTLSQLAEASRRYDANFYDQGKADIEPVKWWAALRECCQELKPYLASVGVVSFSVTTPGLVPMAQDGTALGPAILFCDGRSRAQARRNSSGNVVTSPCREALLSLPSSGLGRTSPTCGRRPLNSATAIPIWSSALQATGRLTPVRPLLPVSITQPVTI